MEMPAEILERISFRAKRIASPDVNLEQLKREPESTRREWWNEIEANKREYTNLPYKRDKFLESNVSLARLKLIATFQDNGETEPSQHGFRPDEVELLRDFEQFIIYDRLSIEDIEDYVRTGKEDERGIMLLAKRAAINGYDEMYHIMEQRNIPGDLAFAFQRIYQDRIKKMEASARQFRLSEAYAHIEEAVTVEEKGGTAQEARVLERSYIVQLEAALKAPGKELKWKRFETYNRLDKIYRELSSLKPTSKEAVRDTLPSGAGIKAVVEKRKLLIFKKTILSLEAKVLSNYKELLLRGLDVKISYAEMMVHIEEALREVKNYPHILALAATSGWEKEAINYAEEGRALSANLSLVLIGLKDKTIHYKSGDERLKQVLPYLEVK